MKFNKEVGKLLKSYIQNYRDYLKSKSSKPIEEQEKSEIIEESNLSEQEVISPIKKQNSDKNLVIKAKEYAKYAYDNSREIARVAIDQGKKVAISAFKNTTEIAKDIYFKDWTKDQKITFCDEIEDYLDDLISSKKNNWYDVILYLGRKADHEDIKPHYCGNFAKLFHVIRLEIINQVKQDPEAKKDLDTYIKKYLDKIDDEKLDLQAESLEHFRQGCQRKISGAIKLLAWLGDLTHACELEQIYPKMYYPYPTVFDKKIDCKKLDTKIAIILQQEFTIIYNYEQRNNPYSILISTKSIKLPPASKSPEEKSDDDNDEELNFNMVDFISPRPPSYSPPNAPTRLNSPKNYNPKMFQEAKLEVAQNEDEYQHEQNEHFDFSPI